jgi:hypothetical protein
MKAKNYIILCLSLSLLVSLTILYVPDVAENFESWLLRFLSTNAAVE